MYGILIGAAGRRLSTSLPPWLNLIQRTIRGVELVLLWTFLPLPSDQAGFMRFRTTRRRTDDEIAKGLSDVQADPTIAGHPFEECIRGFDLDCRYMKDEYLAARGDSGNRALKHALDKTVRPHRSGWINTPEYILFSQNLKSLGAFIGKRPPPQQAR
jgi:hypothetical protein